VALVAATVLAVAWPVLNPTGVLGGQFQKNPVGGFIAAAILLLLGVRELRRLLWCMPILLVGLGALAVVVIIVAGVAVRLNIRRLEAVAEAALPGPLEGFTK